MRQGALQVGRIPSLTWNHLKANEAVLTDGVNLRTQIETNFGELPKGVTHKSMTGAKAAKWLKDHAPAEAPEAVVAGKTPIYHPQAFGTGLGQEYDDLLHDAGTDYELLEMLRR